MSTECRHATDGRVDRRRHDRPLDQEGWRAGRSRRAAVRDIHGQGGCRDPVARGWCAQRDQGQGGRNGAVNSVVAVIGEAVAAAAPSEPARRRPRRHPRRRRRSKPPLRRPLEIRPMAAAAPTVARRRPDRAGPGTPRLAPRPSPPRSTLVPWRSCPGRSAAGVSRRRSSARSRASRTSTSVGLRAPASAAG